MHHLRSKKIDANASVAVRAGGCWCVGAVMLLLLVQAMICAGKGRSKATVQCAARRILACRWLLNA
jgi:hypothetical protein